MSNSKKIMIAIGALVLIAAGAAGVYGFVYMKDASFNRAVESGMAAEMRGDTAQALAEYERALKECRPTDSRCRVDMEMKVKLMTEALKQEKGAKTGDPVPGADKLPAGTAPDDSGREG